MSNTIRVYQIAQQRILHYRLDIFQISILMIMQHDPKHSIGSIRRY